MKTTGMVLQTQLTLLFCERKNPSEDQARLNELIGPLGLMFGEITIWTLRFDGLSGCSELGT
jgi:hypothetical protein